MSPKTHLTMTKINLVIADDHQLFRNCMQTLLGRVKQIEVTHNFDDGEELLEFLVETDDQPDVILLDNQLKPLGVFDYLKILRRKYPHIKVIILSTTDTTQQMIDALKLGAASYITKRTSAEEVFEAVKGAFHNGSYTTEEMSRILLKSIASRDSSDPKRRILGKELSEDEKDVVRLICEEKTNEEIADELAKSRRTIESIRTRIMDKIGCRNMIGIVKYAIKEDIYSVID